MGFSVGDRSDAELAWMWTDVPAAWRHLPVFTDGWGAYSRFFAAEQHTVCDKGSGLTSRAEAMNTKWRQRQSGLVRKSCGVSRRIADDLAERFMILAESSNRERIRQYERERLRRKPLSTRGSP